VPVDLPPVIDEAHVAVMVIDPGPFPGQFAKSMTFLAEAYGLEVPKRLVELPAVVVPDIDLATATQIVEFLGRGGPTLGITDAGMEAEVFGGSPSSPEPSLSPKPSVAPAGL
jgi:hypothetical protein